MSTHRVYKSHEFMQPAEKEPIRSVVVESSHSVIVAWHVEPGQTWRVRRWMRSRSSSLGGGAPGAAAAVASGGRAGSEYELIRWILGLPKQQSHRIYLYLLKNVLR